MSEKTPTELWSEFLAAWPLERVREMTIEEFTNPDKDDAFIYWLESHLQTLGSIWGGSAFKFGVYCRDNTDVKETAAGRAWGDKYAWLTKYGTTAEEAFAVVKSRLTEVAEAAAAGNFARVEEIDLAPVLRWKVAFLYQDREQPSIFPIFKKEALFANYTAIDPRAKLSVTPYYARWATSLRSSARCGNTINLGRSARAEPGLCLCPGPPRTRKGSKSCAPRPGLNRKMSLLYLTQCSQAPRYPKGTN